MVSISAGRPKVVPPAPRVDPTGVKPTNGSKPSDLPVARRTRSRAAAAADNAAVPGTDYVWLRRRQLSHDIRHELGTIMMLASLLSCAEDVGPESRDRARHILGRVREVTHLEFCALGPHQFSRDFPVRFCARGFHPLAFLNRDGTGPIPPKRPSRSGTGGRCAT